MVNVTSGLRICALLEYVFVQVRLLAEARADLNADGKSLRALGQKS